MVDKWMINSKLWYHDMISECSTYYKLICRICRSIFTGIDATEAFKKVGHSDYAVELRETFKVGVLRDVGDKSVGSMAGMMYERVWCTDGYDVRTYVATYGQADWKLRTEMQTGVRKCRPDWRAYRQADVPTDMQTKWHGQANWYTNMHGNARTCHYNKNTNIVVMYNSFLCVRYFQCDNLDKADKAPEIATNLATWSLLVMKELFLQDPKDDVRKV